MDLDLQYITTEQLYYISQEDGNTNIVLPQFNSWELWLDSIVSY